MSLTTVTDAIQAFLATVDGISYVYQEMPWQLTGDAWMNNAEPGTVAIVHIDGMSESRVALPVQYGRKSVTYDVRFLMLYQYRIPSDLGGASMDVWSVGQKALVDAVITKIRSDPSFGNGENGPVWQAGEENNGIHTVFDMPVNIGPGTVACWTSIQFIVTEIVVA